VNFVWLPTGRESRIVLSLALTLMLFLTWGYQLLFGSRADKVIKPAPANKAVMFYVLANIFAYIWGNLTRDVLVRTWGSFPFVQLAALLVNVGLPLLTLLVFHKINDPIWARRYMFFVCFMGGLVALTRLFGLPTEILLSNGANGLFATWSVSMAISLLMFDRQRSLITKSLLISVVGLLVFFYFFKYRIWLSGWLPMTISLSVIALSKSRKVFALLVLAGLVFVAMNATELYQTVVSDNVTEGGLERLDIWRVSIAHVINHPVFGMGPAGYAVYNMTYHPDSARSTHNNYYDIIAQNGIVGMTLFIVMAGTFVRLALQTRKLYLGKSDYQEAFVNATLGGLFASLVAMMLGDWVLPFAYNVTIMGFDHAMHMWFCVGMMLSLRHMALAQNGGSATAPPAIAR
jgi:O-antigen ligase